MSANGCDVLVIGEGLSGIMAAESAAVQGARVTLVSKGPGRFVLGSACIDVDGLEMGTLPVTTKIADAALDAFLDMTAAAECSYGGGNNQRRIVPTILGTFQEVSAAPRCLWQADPRQLSRIAIVGIANLPNFDPNFLAQLFSFHTRGMGLATVFESHIVSLPHNPKHPLTALEIANHIDRDDTYRAAVAHAIRAAVRDVEMVIMPGILGVNAGDAELTQFEREVGCRVCELATLPPSVPGLRLLHRLERGLNDRRVELCTGFPVRKLCIEGERCTGVELDTPGRSRRIRADAVVLACGPFATFLEEAACLGRPSAENVFACGSLLVKGESRHRNAISILTGHQAGLLASQQGVQYAGR